MPTRKDPELAARIVEALREWGYEQGYDYDHEIAEALDVNPRTFEGWARGHVPHNEKRLELAQRTGNDPEYFGYELPKKEKAVLGRRMIQLRREIDALTQELDWLTRRVLGEEWADLDRRRRGRS